MMKVFLSLVLLLLVVCSSSSSLHFISASFNWVTGSCTDAGQVFSTLRRTCIPNPCSAGNVFDSATETCGCPSGQIISPPGSLPSKTGVTCVTCSATNHMTSRSNPPTCLPCAHDVVATPPTVAMRNLFIQGASTTVAINGTTWVYGGGNIVTADGSVSEERVAIVAAQFSTDTSMCNCPTGFILTDTLATGVKLKAFICTRCQNATNATLAGPADDFTCSPCTGGAQYDATTKSCSCNAISSYLVRRSASEGGDYCASEVLRSSVLSSGSTGTTTSTPVNLDNSGTSGPAVESYLFSTFAVSSALGCAAKNATSCQLLANLCALSLYDYNSAACTLHLRLHRAEGCVGASACEQPSTVPWISYLRSSAAVFQETTVNMKLSLRPRDSFVHDLKFILFEYDVYGNVVSRRELVDDFSLCDISSAFAKEFFLVGRRNVVTCNINIRHYIQEMKLKDEPTSLYELFLEDSDGTLIPVPVVLDYSTSPIIPSSVDDGVISRPSAVDQNPRPDAWRRRFFILDNFAGRTSATAIPSHITYARRVSIMINLRAAGTSQIFVPLVVVQYASTLTSPLLTSTDFSSGTLRRVKTNITEPGLESYPTDAPYFEYRVFFVKGDDEVISAVRPTVIVLCIIIFFTAFGKTYGWMRRQQDTNLTLSTLIRFFAFLCNHFANMFAVFCFLTCGAFYVFYKHQSAVEWLLPADLSYVWGTLYAALGCKLFVVLYYIMEQCNSDFFVIDWERPRQHDHGAAMNKNQNQTEGENIGDHQTPQQSHVSMWRSTFVANELNEMQTRRSFHVLFVAVIVLILTEGAKYNDLALSVPNSDLTAGGGTPWAVNEPLLRVAIAGFFWIIVSVVFYIIEFQVYYKFITPHPLQAFTDLCSVSNISILILLEPCWGFYIHGESLHAFADASMEEFQENLAREAQGALPPRGLGGVQDCQTFEVFIGAYLRHFLYVCYGHLYDETGKSLTGQAGVPVHAGHHRRCFEFLFGGAGKPRVFTPQTLSIKRQMNSALQQSVRHAEKNLMNKFGLHAVMDFPPNIMYMNGPMAGERAGADLFFLDAPTNYDQAFMSGLDFDLFILYGLLYATIDANVANTFWSMLAIYLIDVTLEWYRSREGTANLGSKTLFDDRFFL